jgi:uncharacterized damage-inducible protein DinB
MTVKDLTDQYDYGYWANKKLFGVIARLTPEEFTRTVAGSYGSIRNTMVHILSAEAGWLDRCGGAKRGPRLDPADFPTAESVVQAWTNVEAHVREFLASLGDSDLPRDVDYSFNPGDVRTGRLGDLMQHAVVHGVHHRGQVALLLRLLGQVPGNIDLLIYHADKRGAPGL